jgi:hypothetical protein
LYGLPPQRMFWKYPVHASDFPPVCKQISLQFANH